MSLRNVDDWESLSFADTSDLVSGRFSGADAAVWWSTLVEVPVCGKNEHSMLQCQDFTTEVWHCPEFQIVVKLQVFKRHFCYQRVNGSCWAQVVGGLQRPFGDSAVAAPRKVNSIFVTSSEWRYILNEIKEAYRMERFSDHLACRHSIAKSASWDLFARISWKSDSRGFFFMQVEVCLREFRMVFWCILNRLLDCILLPSQLHEPRFGRGVLFRPKLFELFIFLLFICFFPLPFDVLWRSGMWEKSWFLRPIAGFHEKKYKRCIMSLSDLRLLCVCAYVWTSPYQTPNFTSVAFLVGSLQAAISSDI